MFRPRLLPHKSAVATKLEVFRILSSIALPVPPDLEHWVAWYPGLENDLGDFPGALLLLVNLKLRPLREAFMHAW
jgi:hypothetical protein